jgi:hypothetical protein
MIRIGIIRIDLYYISYTPKILLLYINYKVLRSTIPGFIFLYNIKNTIAKSIIIVLGLVLHLKEKLWLTKNQLILLVHFGKNFQDLIKLFLKKDLNQCRR